MYFMDGIVRTSVKQYIFIDEVSMFGVSRRALSWLAVEVLCFVMFGSVIRF